MRNNLFLSTLVLMLFLMPTVTGIAQTNDTVIYNVGFEAEEDFAATTTYNNATARYTGPANFQWGTIYGTPSTTDHITGEQSMQMRWFTNTAATLGNTVTCFDLHYVTKVIFKAKNTRVGGNGLNVTVSFSIDSGTTWMGDSIYSLTPTAENFTYFVSDSGQYDNVRLKFQVTLQSINPTSTVRLIIDDVVVYGIPTIAVPTLHVAPTTLHIVDTAAATFTVIAANLTDNIHIASSNPHFQVTPDSLPGSTGTTLANVTFLGTTIETGFIVVTSGMLSDTVFVTGEHYQPSIDTIIYRTGFEAEEGFSATSGYNNATIRYTGADNFQWGTIYGTPSTTDPIIGEQSMQLRWYTTTPDILGSTVTCFDLHNVTKVTFAAKNTEVDAGLNVKVSFSIDGGIAWMGDSVYLLTQDMGNFTYFINDSGQYNNVRLKFQVSLQPINPTGTVRLIIDDIVAYSELGRFFESDTVSIPYFMLDNSAVIYQNGDTIFIPNASETYQNVSVLIETRTADVDIYYTTDGSEPVSSSLFYENDPLTLGVGTLKAIAVKSGKVNSPISTLHIARDRIGIAGIDITGVILYPNPAYSTIWMDNLREIEAQYIILYNTQGQLIAKYLVTDNSTEISLSNIEVGIYFIQIVTEKGNIIKKVVKI